MGRCALNTDCTTEGERGMTKYNHVFDIAFQVVTIWEEPDRCIRMEPHLIRNALLETLARLTDEDLIEALGWGDTVVEEEDE